jgi:hypothetical protein
MRNRISIFAAASLIFCAATNAQTTELDDTDVSDEFLNDYTTQDVWTLLHSSPMVQCDEVLSWNWRPEYTETSADMDGRVVFRALHAVCLDEFQNRENPIWLGFRLEFATMGRAWTWDLCVAEEFEDLESRSYQNCPRRDLDFDGLSP